MNDTTPKPPAVPEFTLDSAWETVGSTEPEKQANREGWEEALRDLQAARALEPVLLTRMKERLLELEKLLTRVDSHWGMEDGAYRFYHQSWKVYGLQSLTEAIVEALTTLLPERSVNEWFLAIVRDGTGRQFDLSHNQDWLRHTRPILEALFHAKYFLAMVCKYARELETPPQPMPSGWAAVLYLYRMR